MQKIDARIDELARAKADGVRCSIEASITRLESKKQKRQQERLYVEHEIERLEAFVTAPGLLSNYQREIRRTLGLIEQDGPNEKM